jgi:uncharacterized SAM-dependent methyltransferase
MTVKHKDKINDLIFKELIKRGYSLAGNTRIWDIADSKLWYLTPKQAQAYLDLDKTEEYKSRMIDNEIELLKEVIPKIADKKDFTENITLVDVGCGDGKKAIVPINILKNKHKINYCPIDISAYMVNKAIKNISETASVDNVVKFQWNVSDFENLENVTELLRKDGEDLLILFLGSTLGNFETHDLLYALQNSMEFGDSLLIGASLDNTTDGSELARGYINPEVDNFLGHILIELGFSRDEIKFGARYRHHRVECFYEMKEKKTIKFQDREISFYKGDQIIVSHSRKYNQKELEESIKLYFGKYEFYTNKEKNWTLLFCQK